MLTSKGVDILEWKRFAWYSSTQRGSPGEDLKNLWFHGVCSKYCRVENISSIF